MYLLCSASVGYWSVCAPGEMTIPCLWKEWATPSKALGYLVIPIKEEQTPTAGVEKKFPSTLLSSWLRPRSKVNKRKTQKHSNQRFSYTQGGPRESKSLPQVAYVTRITIFS